jgi:hypothetical protein
MAKKFKPQVGELVVFNHNPDATLFRVKAMEGLTLTVVDRDIEDNFPNEQYMDISLAMAPTVAQLKQIK